MDFARPNPVPDFRAFSAGAREEADNLLRLTIMEEYPFAFKKSPRLVEYLISLKKYDEAERWAIEGIENTRNSW